MLNNQHFLISLYCSEMFIKGIQEKEVGKSRKTIPKVNTTCKENGMEKSKINSISGSGSSQT